MSIIRNLRRPILGQIIPGVDKPGEPSTARLSASPAYDRTLSPQGQVLSARSQPSPSHGGLGSFPGAAIKGHAIEWRAFISPGVYGPWQPFPMEMPGTNPGFVAQLKWDWSAVKPPYLWGVIEMEGFCETNLFGWGISLTEFSAFYVWQLPQHQNFQVKGILTATDLDAINHGAWDGIGGRSGADDSSNIIDSVYFALYTSPYPYTGLGRRASFAPKV